MHWNTTHGMHGTPTYNSWKAMKQRCLDTNYDAYSRYGGRGIEVCERWLSFENFLADMGERPPGMTLDRIDNEGNYTPENCHWATSKQQGRNRRTNKLDDVAVTQIRWLCADGGCTQAAVAKAFGVRVSCVSRVVCGKRWA